MRLIELQKEDFAKCVNYFQTAKTEKNMFQGESKSLMKTAHSIAFTMTMLVQKISNVPEWTTPYLNQLRSDTIQILPSVVWGAKRTLHLYERASIEDFLRYVYFFDHKVEHILLQMHPKRFQSIDSMIDWIKEYPALKRYRKAVSENSNALYSRYAELSRTIHGTTIVDQQISEGLKDFSKPKVEPLKEKKIMKAVFGNIFFLLSLFHLEDFRQLQLDERTLVCQHLSKVQIQSLSGLHNS